MPRSKKKIAFSPLGSQTQRSSPITIRKVAFGLIFLLIILSIAIARLLFLTPEEEESGNQISEISNSKYKIFKLSNGMKLLLISDPQSKRSSVSINLNSGYFSDPEEARGNAQLMEHLLVRAKKLPNDILLQDFIEDRGGIFIHNTLSEESRFGFSIVNEYFVEVLYFFSKMFTKPVIDDLVLQEALNETQNDFEERHYSDQFYFSSLVKKVFEDSLLELRGEPNITHLEQKYQINGEDTESTIHQSFREYFSANMMTGVVLSNISIYDLEELVTNHFGYIPSSDANTQNYDEGKVWPSKARILGYISPKFENTLNLVFKKLDLLDVENFESYNYIQDAMQNDASGSFKMVLRDKGWLYDITRVEHSSLSDDYFYNFEFILTRQGKDHVYEIIEYFYSFLDQLAEKGISQERYESLAEVKRLEYEHISIFDDSLASLERLARLLKSNPGEKIFSMTKEFREYNKTMITNFIEESLNTDNLVIVIGINNLKYEVSYSPIELNAAKKSIKIKFANQFDELINLKYCVYVTSSDFSEKIKGNLPSAKFNFTLNRNPFLPSNFDIISPEFNSVQENLSPTLLHGEYNFEIWFSQLSLKERPTARITADIYSMFGIRSCESLSSKAAFRVIYYVLKNFFDKVKAGPISAGYEVSFNFRYNLYSLSVYGFSHQIFQVFAFVISEIFKAKPTAEEFDLAKMLAIYSFKNKKNEHLFQGAYNKLNEAMVHCLFDDDITISELETLKYQEFMQKFDENLDNSYVKVLALGNIRSQSIQEFIIPHLGNFKGRKTMRSHWITSSPNSFYIRSMISGQDGDDQLMMNFYCSGELDPRMDAGLRIITPLLRRFTKKMLVEKGIEAKLVSIFQNHDTNRNGFYIIVQGEKNSPTDVNRVVEEIMFEFIKMLSQIKKADLDVLKEGIISNMEVTTIQELSRIWNKVMSIETYEFNFRKDMLKALSRLDTRDLILFLDIILKDSFKFSYQLVKNALDVNSIGLLKNENYAKRDETKLREYKEILNHV